MVEQNHEVRRCFEDHSSPESLASRFGLVVRGGRAVELAECQNRGSLVCSPGPEVGGGFGYGPVDLLFISELDQLEIIDDEPLAPLGMAIMDKALEVPDKYAEP